MDGLLGVAGMMKLLMKWIIPENSLRLAPVSSSQATIQDAQQHLRRCAASDSASMV
jgi:hypothetical protein